MNPSPDPTFSLRHHLGWVPFSVLLLFAAFAKPAHASVLAAHEVNVPFSIGPIEPDPTRNLVYFIDQTDSALLAINTVNGTVAAAVTIPDGNTSGEIAISVDDTTLYLAESSENEILVYSLPNLTLVNTLSLSFPPYSIATGENGRLFATMDGPTYGELVELDPTDGSILTTFGTSEQYYQNSADPGAYLPIIRTNAAGTKLFAATPSIDGSENFYEYDLTSPLDSATHSYPYTAGNLIDYLFDDLHSQLYIADGGVNGLNIYSLGNQNATDSPFSGPYGEGTSFNTSSAHVFGASSQDIKEFNRTDGSAVQDFNVATTGDPIQERGIAATANDNVVYVRAPVSPNSTSILGFISTTGQPIVLTSSIPQTITFPTFTPNGPSVVLTATSSSGLPITYTVVSGPGRIVGNILIFTNPGTVVVAAHQKGNSIYEPSTTTQSFTIAQGPQTLSAFPVIPDHVYGDSAFAIVKPTSSANLPVGIRVRSGPATLVGNLVLVTGVGSVTLEAYQSGNSFVDAAASEDTSFNVTQAPQLIVPFAPIPTKTLGVKPFAVKVPVSRSGLPVTLSVQSGPATINGNIVTLTGTGTVVLAADQPGNVDYLAAATVTTNFSVVGTAQTITPFQRFKPITFTPTPFAITLPTASSGLSVDVTVVSGPATISGNMITLTGAGTVVLAANQAGNASFAPAAQVITTITVNPIKQTIAPFPVIPTKTFGVAPFNITPPIASSGLAVTVFVKSGPAKIQGNTLTITGPGKVTLLANQLGNNQYAAAPTITTTFKVLPAP